MMYRKTDDILQELLAMRSRRKIEENVRNGNMGRCVRDAQAYAPNANICIYDVYVTMYIVKYTRIR